MMEVMAVEALLELWLKRRNYLTFARLPFWTGSNYSDIDVLGVRHTEHEIHFGECKVRDGAGVVYVIDSSSHGASDFTEYWLGANWSSFIPSIRKVFAPASKNAWIFDTIQLPRQAIRNVTVTFCGNFWVHDDEIDAVNQQFSASLERHLADAPGIPAGVRVSGTIQSSAKIAIDLIENVGEIRAVWGRRWGDPVLDTFRELHRFADPHSTQWTGSGRSKRSEVAQDYRRRIAKAFGITRSDLPE